MSNTQAGPRPEPDNLIIHVAKCLREDVSVPYNVQWKLRQWPINDDDHDSWDYADKLENWYYIAYSIIDDLDPARAKEALIDLVATDSQSQVEPLKSAIKSPSDPKRKANT